MDQKDEDKSEESFQKHLVFYQKLNKTINDIQEEIKFTADSKLLKHLNERIEAIELDKERITKLFPNVNAAVWNV